MKRVTLACLAILAGQAALASDLPPLREVQEINVPLVAAAVAYEVEQGCSQIERRSVRVAIEGWKLALRAQELGYSRSEIKAYIRDDKEVARVRAQASEIIERAGVGLGDEPRLCAFGRAQIKARSFSGRLLREK